ncbi:hypothetical protein SmJEL517_g03771 [Synchytrium microbalum]|uniref:Protein MON2 homolog n=1 Tax=Synchytrium microbalum TaxID=1806994 RepID=A0A507C2P3_9FUNG|nr:uncharacterized protein SmJEL517_g03771 [Synchytrium microbalum]TPX33319.1 hypothetical protein SmJEL517_g03771 [Synchytrium microbalum]
MASGSSGLISLLQNELITLSAEAKKKNPEIKDATDKALYVLRSLKDKAETEPVVPDLQQTEDVLRPFLQACETKNPKMVPLAVGMIQKLIASSCIPESCIPEILQNLTEVMSGAPELQLKVLQTALLLCFKLQTTKDLIVNHAAAATLRQLVIHIFEKVQKADATFAPDAELCASDAKALFNDICSLTVGDPATFLALTSLSRNLGLELIEAVLADHPDQLKSNPELNQTLRDRICPMVIKLFPEKNDFALTMRLMRIVKVIISNFQQTMVMECEIFLSIFSKTLEPEFSLWHRVMVLELYRTFCSDSGLLRSIFRSYDAAPQSVKVFQEMVNALMRIIVTDGSTLLVQKNRSSMEGPQAGSPQSLSGNEENSLSTSSCTMRIPCIEQMDKAEPPVIPELYQIYLATQCLLGNVEAQASFVLPVIQLTAGPEPDPKYQADILLAIEMANTSWGSFLTSFSFLMNSSLDDDLFGQVVKGFTNFSSVVGLLGLASQRDAMLVSLCKCCVPGSSAEAKEAGSRTSNPSLTERNLACLRALLTVTQTLATVLDENGWFVILETIQIAESLIQSGKFGKRATSDGSLLADSPSLPLLPPHIAAALRGRSISNATSPTTNSEKSPMVATSNPDGVENHFLSLLQNTRKLFELIPHMEAHPFAEFITGLGKLAVQSATGLVATASSTTAPRELAPRINDGSSFPISKLHDVALQGVAHLMNRNTDGIYVVWDPLTSSLIEVIHSSSTSNTLRTQACSTLQEIITAVAEDIDMSDGTNEIKIVETLKQLMIVMDDDAISMSDAESDRAIRAQPWFIDVQKNGLDTLNKILQLSGQKLSNSWYIVFQVLKSCMPPSNRQKRTTRLLNSDGSNPGLGTPTGSMMGVELAELSLPTTPAPKTVALVRVGFPSLQFICTDFLGLLDSKTLVECIEVVGLFASQQDDLNISLTSIGLLWSISDFVLRKKEKQELRRDSESDSTPTDLTSDNPDKDNLMAAVEASPMSDSMWKILLQQLSLLCSDTRPEVRNSASQSLFRTVSLNGNRLNLDAWKECIYQVMFPLLEHIQLCSDRMDNTKSSVSASENRGSLSGSPLIGSPTSATSVKNAVSKQWDETKVLTLQGFAKCFIDFQDVLVGLEEDFARMWKMFLRYLKHWCFGGSMDVAMAAVQSIKAILSRQHEKGSNMVMAEILWDTWCDIGMGILEVKEASDPDAESPVEEPVPEGISLLQDPLWRRPTFSVVQGFFSQDVLQQFVHIFPDIYRPVKWTFTAAHYKKIFDIMAGLVTYHSRPIPGTSLSKMKADMVNDLETATSLQVAILDQITMLCDGDATSDWSLNEPEMCIMFLGYLSSLPLNPRVIVMPGSINNLSTAAAEPGRGFTYIAISRKAMIQSTVVFEKFSTRLKVYETGATTRLIRDLGDVMKQKYDCPEVGKRDTTPLWKSAANACLTVSNLALQSVSQFIESKESSFESHEELFDQVLSSFEAFFLSPTLPSPSASADDMAADVLFDQTLLTKVETEILPKLIPAYVSDGCIKRFASILKRAAKNELEEKPSLRSASSDSSKIGKLSPMSASSIEDIIKISPENNDVLFDRDAFIKASFVTLCRLCSMEETTNARVAGIIAPMLVDDLVENALREFIKDQLLYGRLTPLPK